MDKRQKQMLSQMAPIFGFIFVMFVTEAFRWMMATKVVWATFTSLLIYFIMVADLRARSKGVLSIKKIDPLTAMLTAMFLIVFASGFLDWYHILSQFQRMAIILFVLLIYFVLLFRAMRTYLEFLEIVKQKGK
jgi:hypothetical protein